MSLKVTYFVHGTTEDNLEHITTGWLPGKLSEKGIKQSIELIDQIKDKKFDVVISSDLQRAIDSARLTWPERDIEIDERLRECNYGRYNGEKSSIVIYEDHIDNPFPEGESLKDVEIRVRQLIEDLKAKYDGKTIAIVAHKATQLAFEVITKNISWESAIDSDWRKTKDWKPGWEYIV